MSEEKAAYLTSPYKRAKQQHIPYDLATTLRERVQHLLCAIATFQNDSVALWSDEAPDEWINVLDEAVALREVIDYA